MPGKPKINVTQVWILQKDVPYDGSEILNVYLDPEEAKKAHTGLGSWHYDEKEDNYYTSGFSPEDKHGNYFLLTRHPILVTRKTKPQPEEVRIIDVSDTEWLLRKDSLDGEIIDRAPLTRQGHNDLLDRNNLDPTNIHKIR